jgi:solute carrier family 45 protein 1/2/4
MEALLNPSQASFIAKAIAVVSFYVLDFALNACQASLRNLLLDIAPSDQLSLGNAWHGRMSHAGNIIGTAIGTCLRLQLWTSHQPLVVAL